jgi:hypothetical protein
MPRYPPRLPITSRGVPRHLAAFRGVPAAGTAWCAVPAAAPCGVTPTRRGTRTRRRRTGRGRGGGGCTRRPGPCRCRPESQEGLPAEGGSAVEVHRPAVGRMPEPAEGVHEPVSDPAPQHEPAHGVQRAGGGGAVGSVWASRKVSRSCGVARTESAAWNPPASKAGTGRAPSLVWPTASACGPVAHSAMPSIPRAQDAVGEEVLPGGARRGGRRVTEYGGGAGVAPPGAEPVPEAVAQEGVDHAEGRVAGARVGAPAGQGADVEPGRETGRFNRVGDEVPQRHHVGRRTPATGVEIRGGGCHPPRGGPGYTASGAARPSGGPGYGA